MYKIYHKIGGFIVRRSNKAVVTTLICSVCETKFPIARRSGKLHKSGHVKHMWCFKCKKEVAFIDGNTYDKVLKY